MAVRIRDGQVNIAHDKTSRSIGDIIRANIFTRFNALIATLFLIVLVIGSLVDGLFFIAIIFNSAMGIIQELRAKQTLDRLTILNAPRVTVLRDGVYLEIMSTEIVLDDIVKLKLGDQIPADGVVLESTGCEVDESLLTGESDAVHKNTDDKVLSGAMIVAGSCLMRTTAVGEAAYAHRLAAEVKKFTITRSELMEGTNRLLGYISVIILLVAPLLVWGQIARSGASWQEASIRSVAAIVGMIPEGLVVLTSMAFVIATVTLSRRNVLVRELPAVEGLARVDVICLDKTGTLTEGVIVFDRLEMIEKNTEATVRDVLGAIAREPDSSTLHALHKAFSSSSFKSDGGVPFNSKRKWSALHDKKGGSWVMGAPEIVLSTTNKARRRSDEIASEGLRVMVLAKSERRVSEKALPSNIKPVALIVLGEKIRDDAAETLEYFARQGVTLKIISGDNPRTVAAIAEKVGLRGVEAIDARTLPDDQDELAELLETHHVFGRVLPEQKRLFVQALQSRGHVVAMTGDGVNDALALKDADIGVAMASGAPATRAVAQLVLLDNKFAHMPDVLSEGRRVIANIERVANLFVIKNVYTLVFALAVTLFALPFPFLPRHQTIIASLTIGIPAFFLALAPNYRRYQPGFLRRVLLFSVPIGATIAAVAMGSYMTALKASYEMAAASSIAATSVVIVSLWVLVCIARPLKLWKIGLIALMALVFVIVVSVPWLSQLLEFYLSPEHMGLLTGFTLAGCGIVELIWRLTRRREARTHA